jgi:DNA uptake protein ComE-like DNA-binding protein
VSSPVFWTSSQRGVLIALLSLLLICLTVRLILNPVYVSNPQPQSPPRAGDLEDRVNPNNADVQTLSSLPQIGEKRARDIVAYREQFVAAHPGQIAFSKPLDLLHIRGIGASMLEQLEPFLIFPTTAPTTSQ